METTSRYVLAGGRECIAHTFKCKAAGSLVLGPQMRVSFALKLDQSDFGLVRTDLEPFLRCVCFSKLGWVAVIGTRSVCGRKDVMARHWQQSGGCHVGQDLYFAESL